MYIAQAYSNDPEFIDYALNLYKVRLKRLNWSSVEPSILGFEEWSKKNGFEIFKAWCDTKKVNESLLDVLTQEDKKEMGFLTKEKIKDAFKNFTSESSGNF